jgi:hypothetical protein
MTSLASRCRKIILKDKRGLTAHSTPQRRVAGWLEVIT